MPILKTRIRKWFGQTEISLTTVADETARLMLTYEFAKNKIVVQTDTRAQWILNAEGNPKLTSGWTELTHPEIATVTELGMMPLTAGVAATGTLTLTGPPTSMDSISISGDDDGKIIYKNDDDTTPVIIDNPLIEYDKTGVGGGSSAPKEVLALAYKEIINGESSSQAGITFFQNPFGQPVTATVLDGVVTLTAENDGTAANAITLTDNLTAGSFSAATLEGGIDEVVENPPVGEIPLDTYDIRNNGDDLFICANIEGTVKSIALGTAT